MSEVKLNLIDADQTVSGKIHGAVADAAVAALSAEPETIAELESALARFRKPGAEHSPFTSLHATGTIDNEPWDAGIVIIDLAARIVASESIYSTPEPQGDVRYHDGKQLTEVDVLYRVPEDWLFQSSVREYEETAPARRAERASVEPLDGRAILYGRPLLEWIVTSVQRSHFPEPSDSIRVGKAREVVWDKECDLDQVISSLETKETDRENDERTGRIVTAIHAAWLLKPREDLRGESPRDVLHARKDLIDADLNSREMQWTFLGEGPPCIDKNSRAYKYGGFGTHELVVYYDLVRHLIWSAVTQHQFESATHATATEQNPCDDGTTNARILRMEQIMHDWLEKPQPDYDGRIPSVIVENQRKRLPLALCAADMVIDENCPVCQMLGHDIEMGGGPGFWHLDGAHMDDHFAFSFLSTYEEWVEDRIRWEEFNKRFHREWEERELRRAAGEEIDDVDFMSSELPELESVDPESVKRDKESAEPVQ